MNEKEETPKMYHLRAQTLKTEKRYVALDKVYLRMMRSINQRKPLTGRVIRFIINAYGQISTFGSSLPYFNIHEESKETVWENQLQSPKEDICRKPINRSTLSGDVSVFIICAPNRKVESNNLDLQIPRYRDYLISVIEPYQWSILIVSSLYPAHTVLILQPWS